MCFKGYFTLGVLLTLALVRGSSGIFCDICPQLELKSTGGIEQEMPLYTGTWINVGSWDGSSYFYCINCNGLDRKLLYIKETRTWEVRDCFPTDTAGCFGSHALIKSKPTDGTVCPEGADQFGYWEYCSGDIVPAVGCSPFQEDPTATFECVA